MHTYLLDGDNLRLGLNQHLGFTPEDRCENIRRVSEVAKLMVDAGIIVIAATISPLRAARDTTRALFDDGGFIEVFVDAPLAVTEARDPKGLYALARRGRSASSPGSGRDTNRPLHLKCMFRRRYRRLMTACLPSSRNCPWLDRPQVPAEPFPLTCLTPPPPSECFSPRHCFSVTRWS
jgi:adenylylsulfate kinase-like enzyme